MREILRRAKPQRLDDLIAMNALYRPGPLKGGMVDDFIAARPAERGEIRAAAARADPRRHLRRHRLPGTGDAHGAVLAGFTLGQSDVLRKAMGKKGPQGHGKQREAFIAGARAKGISEKKASKIFELMEYFAGYGFNKSHSTAYAFLAYQTAYLKANYPRTLRRRCSPSRRQHRQAGASTSASAATAASPCCRRTSTRASCTSRWCPKASASA